MNAADLDRLAALAAAATPGGWVHNGGQYIFGETPGDEVAVTNRRPDAAFIAACDPSTVTALIERIRELEADVIRAASPSVVSRRARHGTDLLRLAAAQSRTRPMRSRLVNAPMQPDYRRRMEAAEAELARRDELTREGVRLWRKKTGHYPENHAEQVMAERDAAEARAEAAEQRVKELEAERDRWKGIVTEAALETYMPEGAEIVAQKIHQYARDAETAVAERDRLREKYLASDRDATNWCVQFTEAEARADAAEAREQALRDLLTELADEGFSPGPVILCDTPRQRDDQWRKQIRAALLSLATADTEESDR